VKRQLGDAEFKDASRYSIVYVGVILFGAVIIALLPTITFDQAIYEVSSAISSAGNSMIDFLAYSAEATAAGRIYSYNILLVILVVYMFLGRLEILPVFYAASYVFHPNRGAARTGGEIN
jgi:Trk-type K+ transport system membrane component